MTGILKLWDLRTDANCARPKDIPAGFPMGKRKAIGHP
jgi:hypothetical protein